VTTASRSSRQAAAPPPACTTSVSIRYSVSKSPEATARLVTGERPSRQTDSAIRASPDRTNSPRLHEPRAPLERSGWRLALSVPSPTQNRVVRMPSASMPALRTSHSPGLRFGCALAGAAHAQASSPTSPAPRT